MEETPPFPEVANAAQLWIWQKGVHGNVMIHKVCATLEQCSCPDFPKFSSIISHVLALFFLCQIPPLAPFLDSLSTFMNKV